MMKNKHILLLISLFCAALGTLKAQTWRLHLNANEYYPINAKEKGYYPILWYSSDEGRGVLLGGFGGGVSWSKSFRKKWGLKTQLNVSRSRYYDEPVVVYDEIGFPYTAVIGITTNLNANVLCVPTFSLTNWLQLGAGLGAQSVLYSKSKYGQVFSQGKTKDLKFTNKSIQPVIMVFPVEMTALFGRFSFSTRFEFNATKVSRLSYATDERFMTGYLELGYRLGGMQSQPQ